MIIIKTTTKRGQNMLDRSNNWEGYNLREVYSSFSFAKERAWDYCRTLCRKEGGRNFRIISHNTFGFSVAWDIPEGVRIETPQNSYLIEC